MTTKLILPIIVAAAAALFVLGTNDQGARMQGKPGTKWGLAIDASPKRDDKLVLRDEEWKRRLTPEQFRILRGHGTEAAFCGIFHDNKKTGTYHCQGCELPLFKSDAKFDSGTGWPSFFQPVEKANVWLRKDTAYGMVRWEVLCARCDGHLGHVFEDGPPPSGLRFCINSESMGFTEEKAAARP